MKTFSAKIRVYDDRVNIDLPSAAEALGPLEIEEFDARKKRVILRPGGGRRKGCQKGPDVRRYQYTIAVAPKFQGTVDMVGRVEGGKIVLEPRAYKTPEEIFG